MSINTKMTAIADEIREMTGTTDIMGLDTMATNLNAANTEIVDQSDLISQISTLLEGKASGNPEIPSVEQATPEISVDSSGLITASVTQESGNVSGGTKIATKQLPVLSETTYIPTTSDQIIDANRYLIGQQVIKGDPNLVPENIPQGISLFGINGTREDGGSGDNNSNLEDAIVTRVITEYRNDRVTSIGSYAFYGCDNLKSISFPACTSIGGYTFISCKGLTSIDFPVCTSIGNYAFSKCTNLTSVNFPVCTSIGQATFSGCTSLMSISFPVCKIVNYNAFRDCTNLTSVDFPMCISVNGSAFQSCTNLTSISFPVCTNIGGSAFQSCTKLTSVSFPVCVNISGSAFSNCTSLIAITLNASSVCKLSNSNAFTSTPIGGYSTSAGCFGSIYVPASLLTSYQSATNWTYFSSRFVGV